MPDTMPESVTTVATDVLLLFHNPPATVLDSVTVEPGHVVDAPDSTPAVALTVTMRVATDVPQELVIVYLIVSRPGVIPVMMPDEVTVAFALLALHIPPTATPDSVAAAPVHIIVVPVMIPGSGSRQSLNLTRNA